MGDQRRGPKCGGDVANGRTRWVNGAREPRDVGKEKKEKGAAGSPQAPSSPCRAGDQHPSPEAQVQATVRRLSRPSNRWAAPIETQKTGNLGTLINANLSVPCEVLGPSRLAFISDDQRSKKIPCRAVPIAER